MLRRIWFAFLVLILLGSAALSACRAPTPTPVPSAPTQPAPAADAVLTVAGKAFSLEDLQAMEQVTVQVEEDSYTGVRLLDVLEAAGVEDGDIEMVADDGYSGSVAVSDLTDECLLAFNDKGGVDTVLPGIGRGAWVKGTVEIKASSGGSAPTEPTSAPAPAADAALTVGGKPFSLEDLQAMEQVTIEVEGKSYTGPRLLDVLEAAGIADGHILMVAGDGYSGGIAVATLTDECVLAFNTEGSVNAVFPGIDKGLWVKYIVEITLDTGEAGGPAASGTPVAMPTYSGETRVVVDSLGNEVTIPKEVSKVASMRSGITEIICALGEKDKIIAVDEMTKAGTEYGAFIAGVYPELMECSAPYWHRDIHAEEMLRLAPDVVLHGGYGRIQQAEALKKQVPQMPIVIAHFETIEHYMDDIRIVAECVNATDRAEDLIATLQEALDKTTARVKDIPEAERVRVFYGGHDIYHAMTGTTFEHAQVVLAGGVNVAGELTTWNPEITPEQLLVWDPEVVVLLNGGSVSDVLNDKRLAGLSAVKSKRVYALPEAGWDYSTPRALFCIEWLASKLYPDRFADVDIEAEADAFYQKVFGVDYTGPAL